MKNYTAVLTFADCEVTLSTTGYSVGDVIAGLFSGYIPEARQIKWSEVMGIHVVEVR